MSEDRKNEQLKDQERIRNFRLMDDDFMTKCFEDDLLCTELVLRIVLEKDDLCVQSVQTQKFIKNLQGRSIRTDILATDSRGKKYNIEVQRDDSGAVEKRARYNGSIIDANITNPGDKHEKLPESYVIFITENDAKGVTNMCKMLEEMREEAEARGETKKLVYLVCKKLQKSKSPEMIADELGEDYIEIERICNIANEYTPYYDCDQILEHLEFVRQKNVLYNTDIC